MSSAKAPFAVPPNAQGVALRRLGLVGKYQGGGSFDGLQQVAELAMRHGAEVVLDADTAAHWPQAQWPSQPLSELARACDAVLVVGGDGTMLGAGRALAACGVPVIGINHGRLGFITDIALDDVAQTLVPMLQGAYETESRPLMQASVWRQDACVFEATTLNDVVVYRGGASGMVELTVHVGERFLARQRADGLIVASPTGSTAYALSAGGPILHPSIAGWVLVPIAPHTLSNRPIVLPASETVTIEVVAARDAHAHFDMQRLTSLQVGDRVCVQASQHALQLLHPQGWSYFDTLRRKLHWNEGVV